MMRITQFNVGENREELRLSEKCNILTKFKHSKNEKSLLWPKYKNKNTFNNILMHVDVIILNSRVQFYEPFS